VILDTGNLLDSRGNVYRIWTYRTGGGADRVRREPAGEKHLVAAQPFPGSAGKSEVEGGTAAAEGTGHPWLNEYRCLQQFHRVEPVEIGWAGEVHHDQGQEAGTLESCDQVGRRTPMELGAGQADPIPYT
jgi:hypothetical protein